MFRKREQLETCFPCTAMAGNMHLSLLWTAINAITQVETSTRGTTAAKGRAQFARGTFGAGASISKRAFAVAQDLLVSC